MKKYEYKEIEVLGHMTPPMLNFEGEEGWQLVDKYQYETGYSDVRYVFMREKEE